jgi:hypothetical protein
MALDPANARARKLLTEFQDDSHKPADDQNRPEKNSSRVWQMIGWLESPEAGNEAHALANCLKDVMVVVDPHDPRTGEIRNNGEKGAWDGWIPPLSAYQKKAPEVAGGDVTGGQTPETPDSTAKSGMLRKAQVGTLVWSRPEKDWNAPWKLTPAPLLMTAKQAENNEFTVSIGADHDDGSYARVVATIKRLLVKCHGELPKGMVIHIGGEALATSIPPEKRLSISAAAAVLASAAVTGIEPDAIILGDVTEDGVLKLPQGFWDQIQSLGKGSGRRLVLPAEAATCLPSVLAMENPGFFLQYEVLLAADFKQMLEMAAKTPRGTIASPIQRFHEIQDHLGALDVRQYISNSFIRQRLLSIFQEFPDHFSTKMLLIQASGNRPVLVPRGILASELRRAMQPCLWIVRKEDALLATDAANVVKTYEDCRAKVDALERYAERKDRDLIERARATATSIRAIDRGLRARGEHINNSDLAATARREFLKSLRALNDTLSIETGETKDSNQH